MVVYCCFYLCAVICTPCVMLFFACAIAGLRKSKKEDTVYNTCGDYFVFVERYCSKETNLLQRKRNRYVGKKTPLPPPPKKKTAKLGREIPTQQELNSRVWNYFIQDFPMEDLP